MKEIEMLEYLKQFHCDDITNLLNDSNDNVHVSLNVNLTHLQKNRLELFNNVLQNVWNVLPQWNRALLDLQKSLIEGNNFLEEGFQIKENCHVRFINLPQPDGPLKGSFPGNDNVGQFVQVKGNVVRLGPSRLLEFKREYKCTRCKETFTLEAEYSKRYVFEASKRCLDPAGLCKGNLQQKHPKPQLEYCVDYQELRIQELFSDKYIPSSQLVTLDNDLVDYCQPGDCITICGTIEVRWPQLVKGKRFEVDIALRAVSIFKDDEQINFGKGLSEQLIWVRAQWQDTVDRLGYLHARDMIIGSICPEIHGMYLVKLAIALALCSGVQYSLGAGANKRGSSHLLLVGDPGLAKSKLLKAASKIALRSVHTTGMGCSSAGLTAAAVREEGEWQLEAGALVLADGGVCCIDEFNLMSHKDKGSIHESMEQQTISMAKAGLVCKLSTRCVIIAATNPKYLYTLSDIEGTSSMSIGVGSPLLSRFDVVLILRDERDPEWDNRICDHILKNTNLRAVSDDVWELERLQSHFMAVQEIDPELTDEANILLGSYYKHCRSDPQRDPSRTTARLLDSINRLAQAHARLMFREKVEAVDAIVVIRLMESSWGFGRLLNSIDILREDLPLGPEAGQVHEITSLLGLESWNNQFISNLTDLNISKRQSEQPKDVPFKNSIIGNLESLFGFNKEKVKKLQTCDSASKVKMSSNEDIDNKLSPIPKLKCDKNSTKQPKSTSNRKSPIHKTKSTKTSSKPKNNLTDTFRKTSGSDKENNSNEESTNSEALKNSLLEEIMMDDSCDIDLIVSLDTVQSQTVESFNSTQHETISEVVDEKATKSEHSYNISSPKAKFTSFKPLFGTGELDDDFDDADLDLDFNVTPKFTSPSHVHGNSDGNKPPESTNKATTKRKSLDDIRVFQEQKESIENSPKPESSKKARLSFGTLAKLNTFRNPKLIDTTVVDQEDKIAKLKDLNSSKLSTEDSAYDSMNIQAPLFLTRPPAPSNSHFLASLDDDLDCLDLDI